MLELKGYDVRTAASLEAAHMALTMETPDLVVLDIMLPDGSGLDFCRELRDNPVGIPVLFLPGRAGNNGGVIRKRSGSHYLPGSRDYEALLARIEALLPRSKGAGGHGFPLKIGSLAVDYTARRVCLDGEEVPLKPREFSLLLFLANNAGVYFRPEILYKQVWALNPSGDIRTVYTHISSLRKKLEISGDATLYLEQKRGKGYRLMIESCSE